MWSSKLSFLIPAVLLFVTLPAAAVEDLSPEEVQQENQIYNQLEQDGQMQGGKTQQYLDETNNVLQRDQPTEVQIQNDAEAERVLRQTQGEMGQPNKATQKAKKPKVRPAPVPAPN
jgi:hypothetical protein